jgi:hypothetical protein
VYRKSNRESAKVSLLVPVLVFIASIGSFLDNDKTKNTYMDGPQAFGRGKSPIKKNKEWEPQATVAEAL